MRCTDPRRWSITFALVGAAIALAGPPAAPATAAGAAAGQPPTVTLTSPTAGTFIPYGRTFTMAATAADPDGAVTVVQFFVGDALVGTDDQAPYEISVSTGLTGTGSLTGWARAFDDGSPPQTADSARVPFTVVTVPPLSIVAEPTAMSVTEGGTASFDLRMSSSGADARVALTVADAPGVTVSPTAVVFGPTVTTQRVTVTAAPGSGGQVATVTAAADPAQSIGPARVTVTVLDDGAGRVANPYQGAQVYVDPDWAAQARAQAATTPGALGRQMRRVAGQPTAVWLDAIAALTRGRGLAGHLDAALAQQRASGATAMVVQLVLYNIPGRDCMERAAPGELTVHPVDLQRYRAEFIDRVAEVLSRPQYANLRVVTVVEPGALPSLVLAVPPRPFPNCTGVRDTYVSAVRYALARLGALRNAYNYLDFSFSGFFGYPDNAGPAAQLYADIVLGAGGPGATGLTGFVTNVGQYAPLAEPHIPDPDRTVGGMPVYTSRFFDWNREIHEQTLRAARPRRPDRAGLPGERRHAHRHRPQRMGRAVPTGRAEHLAGR